MSTWKTTRTTRCHLSRDTKGLPTNPRSPYHLESRCPDSKDSSEVAKILLAGGTARARGELILHEACQATELVHAPWPEARVVVVEEDKGSLHRIRGAIELLVPGAHLRGLVLLDLLEFRDLAVPDHPQVHLIRRHLARSAQVLILRPHHRDVPIPQQLVD